MTVVSDGKIGFYLRDGVTQLDYKQTDSLGQKQMANGKLGLRTLVPLNLPTAPLSSGRELLGDGGRWLSLRDRSRACGLSSSQTTEQQEGREQVNSHGSDP